MRTFREEVLSLREVVDDLVVDGLDAGAFEFKLHVGRQFQRHAHFRFAVALLIHIGIEVDEREIHLRTDEVGLTLHAIEIGQILVGGMREVFDFIEHHVDHVDMLVELVPRGGVVADNRSVVVRADILLPSEIAIHADERLHPRLANKR